MQKLMSGKLLIRSLACATSILALSGFHAFPHAASVSPLPANFANHYIDCSARQNGDGTETSPWNSLTSVNGFSAHSGDHLLFKRATTCNGVLAPQGSGSASASIVIDAYGTGVPPVIDGGHAEEAVKLFNQQYWEINNLEITGGNLYGVYVTGDVPNSTLNHIYLKNLDVHGANFTSTKRSDSGEVFISPNGSRQTLNDILVDGVVAHDSHVSEGIIVSAGGAYIETNEISQPLGNDVTVRNSTAHDVYGDGIMIAELTNGLLERNVVYRSGLCPNCTGSTPVGLWEWYCHTCTVQYNESYANQSWGGDGGDFDIDYFDNDNIVQYNYGHDSAGYCVAFFGAGGRASVNNVFRYNVCSNDGRRSDISNQGEVFIHTWDNGSLDGVEIYNNVFYWNPASKAAAFVTTDAAYSGAGPRFFKNNIIYATVPDMIETTSSFVLDNNVYWTTASSPTWKIDGKPYTDFKVYQSAAKQDAHSHFADPMLSSPSYHATGRPEHAFHPLPNSPGIHTGANVCVGTNRRTLALEDYWGHHISDSACNIGPYQGP
jgi:Right handed beta helix region